MPKYSDLIGLPVLCADEGRVAGRVTGALIDGGRRAAACLLVDLETWYLGVQALPLDRVTGLSAAAVMTSGVRELRPIADDERLVRIAQAGARIEGLDVYTPQGDPLGKAADFTLDLTGAIQSIILEDGQEIPGRYLLAIGPDAIIAEFEHEVIRLDTAREQSPHEAAPREPPAREPGVKAEPTPRTEPSRAAAQQVQVSGGGNVTVRTNVASTTAQGVQIPR